MVWELNLDDEGGSSQVNGRPTAPVDEDSTGCK